MKVNPHVVTIQINVAIWHLQIGSCYVEARKQKSKEKDTQQEFQKKESSTYKTQDTYSIRQGATSKWQRTRSKAQGASH